MPKGSNRTAAKSYSRSKGRRSRRYRLATQQKTPIASTHISSSKGASGGSSVSSPSRIEQIVPQYPYLGSELKRIGIIAAAMLVILIVLSVLL